MTFCCIPTSIKACKNVSITGILFGIIFIIFAWSIIIGFFCIIFISIQVCCYDKKQDSDYREISDITYGQEVLII